MTMLKDLTELLNAGVITSETADKIEAYYRDKKESSTNWLFIVFGILGATLIGLGVILIIAHNWDELSRLTKTIIAFLPLLIGQIICGYVLVKKMDSVAWREGSSTFLFFAIGACISLVSQIYNMPGNLSSFLFIWMLLSLPLIYVMRSSVVSLLYLMGITYYACETCYWTYPTSESHAYWILLILALPHYYLLYKHKPRSNFMFFHNWIVPLSVLICLGIVVKSHEHLIFIAYFSLLGLLYLIGHMSLFSNQNLRKNAYKVLGSLGTVILMLVLSFDWFWKELRREDLVLNEVIAAPELWAAIILTAFASCLLYLHQRDKRLEEIKPLGIIFILFIITFVIGLFSAISVVLINLFVFILGILTIRDGANQNHLGILNYGLLMITALVLCRFFDTDLSFVLRGILFVSIGVGFFATNYWMLQKRKNNG